MSVSQPAGATLVDLSRVPHEDIITFAEGLVGQPEWKRFVLLTLDEDEAGVGLLQSIDIQDLSLLVTDPAQFLPDYTFELSDGDREQLRLDASTDPMVLTTLSVHGQMITTNLVGPLVINPVSRVAKQIVLTDSNYSTQHLVTQIEGQGA